MQQTQLSGKPGFPVLNLPRHLAMAGGGKGRWYEMKAARNNAAEIFIYDVIGDPWDGTTAKQFAKDLKALGAVSELRVFINSPGGSVFDGHAIYNQLARHKARKLVNIDGIAASIASVVAMAGDEISIAANGMMMIHDPWTLGFGNAEDFRKLADTLDKIGGTILDTYVARTGTDADRIAAMMREETWLDARDAVDLGFADSIGEEVPIAAKARGFDFSDYRHAPSGLVEAAAAPALTRDRAAARIAAMRKGADALSQFRGAGPVTPAA